ncbi:MAG: WYL domain-containing protein [Lachnospiraceae bacterium]|nr:WYL domain-containing protein [Lachnospiraceae bacterium]
MSDYQELIKNFERIRDYMRQFFLYGFKVRSEFGEKSGRTYDNERRRIESYLAGYIHMDYTSRGKQVSVHMDSKQLSTNPLYAAWKSKSFTDNDLLLHFFLPDLLGNKNAFTVSALCDLLAERLETVPDLQTVRNKCREYERLGILEAQKNGKAFAYRLTPPMALENTPLYKDLMQAVKFCSEAMPFGIVGSTLLDREFLHNDLFCWKHYFLVHTLEDQALLKILDAMKEHRTITFENHSVRSGNRTQIMGLPLRIFVSTQTGRRYVCLYFFPKRRFNCLRLDCISKVKPLELCSEYELLREKLEKNLAFCWGVSFGGHSRMETLCMKLYIDEKRERHIINRLHREGRGGEVLKVREHVFLYTGVFFDANEMLSWVKSFTGRILDLQCSNDAALRKVTRDLEEMYEMYSEVG